jgi:small subunit ribosomal protein S20
LPGAGGSRGRLAELTLDARRSCAYKHAFAGPSPDIAVPRDAAQGSEDTKADDMANIRSAKKRIRQTARKTAVNRNRISRVRTFMKKVEAAIATGDKDGANAALKAAQPEIMRGVTRGVLHRNTASRKVARLNARIKAL